MAINDILTFFHPVLAVAFVFPLIGVATYFALQTRQRRLQTAEAGKSKLPPTVGVEHVKIGRWLSSAVVALSLVGLGQPILKKFMQSQTWTTEPLRVTFVVLMFVLTVASFVILTRARTKLWRGIFATLTGMGLVLLGCQPEIFRRGFEWYASHYYFGMTATMLMIFSLAIVPDIYQDKSNRWRNTHIALNSVALLLFVGQGFTGTRDLLEIPLDWQKPYIEQLYIQNCQTQPCQVQPAPAPEAETPPS